MTSARNDTRSGETNFDDVIAPLDRDSFVAEFWNKTYRHFPGSAGRFAALLSWDELSEMLAQFQLERFPRQPPRLRLVRGGNPVEVARYIDDQRRAPRLNLGGLVACLSQGATLVVDGVDDLAPRLRALAERFQAALGATTTINLYAGWRKENGFDLHWDAQDVVIMQLSGRKQWKVYAPTRLHPLKDDPDKPPKPTGEPVWDGILDDGDAIYLPRGWWHVAYPLDEPSLHLTVTIVPAHGTDLLQWLVDDVRRHREVRMDVPRLADAATQKRYIAKLRDLIVHALDDEAAPRFLRAWDAGKRARPRIDLPLGPVRQTAALTMASRIRLAANRRLAFETDAGGQAVHFQANGNRWQCGPELVPALEALSSETGASLRDLCDKLPDQDAAAKLKRLLTALAMAGVILQEASD